MKKVVLLLFAIVFANYFFGQDVQYRINVETDTATYQPLNIDSAQLLLGDTLVWDPFDLAFDIPLGFDLEWGDVTIDSIDWMYAAGAMVMQEKGCDTGVYSVALNLNWWLDDKAHLFFDSTKRTLSPILYQRFGSPGKRKLIFEWRNVMLSEKKDSLNFQIIFSEEDQSISYHFGEMKYNLGDWFSSSLNGQAPYFYFQYQMNCFDPTFSRMLFMTENPDSPTVKDGFLNEWPLELEFFGGAPSHKTRWTFTLNKTVSIPEIINDEEYSFYPNPSTGEVFFTKVPDVIKVYNLNGELVEHHSNKSNTLQFNLPTGIYILQLISSENIAFRKLIIK